MVCSAVWYGAVSCSVVRLGWVECSVWFEEPWYVV